MKTKHAQIYSKHIWASIFRIGIWPLHREPDGNYEFCATSRNAEQALKTLRWVFRREYLGFGYYWLTEEKGRELGRRLDSMIYYYSQDEAEES